MAKTELFDKNLRDAAQLFKALAHPARLAILKHLAETEVCISGDISVELPLSRTTVNQHLTVLKNEQLIKGNISGTRVNYCLNVDKIKQVKPLLDHFMNDLETCTNHQC
jgi:ArsR family transcriptional regulator, arsenate/arsenite/antimonite-responsive transcriptional repressor